MNVLWISECPQHATGFGKVTHYMTKLLRENSFNVVVSCFSQFAVTQHNGIYVYPYGNPLSEFVKHIERRHGEIDTIVFHGAPFIIPFSEILPQVKALKNKRVIGYFVHEFLHAPKKLVDIYKYVHLLAVPTQYLAHVLGITRYTVVRHGVNPEIWYPRETKYDRFTISMVAKNHPRKRFDILLNAISLLKTNGYDVQLLLYTDTFGYWNLPAIIQSLESYYNVSISVLKPTDYETFTGLPEHEQADIVCKSHVHTLPTGGEAFALPVAETLSCGLPNIVTSFPALREIYNDHVVYLNSVIEQVSPYEGTIHLIPSAFELMEKLRDIVEHYDEYREKALKSSEYVRKTLSWENAVKQMINAIELVQKYDDLIIDEQHDRRLVPMVIE